MSFLRDSGMQINGHRDQCTDCERTFGRLERRLTLFFITAEAIIDNQKSEKKNVLNCVNAMVGVELLVLDTKMACVPRKLILCAWQSATHSCENAAAFCKSSAEAYTEIIRAIFDTNEWANTYLFHRRAVKSPQPRRQSRIEWSLVFCLLRFATEGQLFHLSNGVFDVYSQLLQTNYHRMSGRVAAKWTDTMNRHHRCCFITALTSILY